MATVGAWQKRLDTEHSLLQEKHRKEAEKKKLLKAKGEKLIKDEGASGFLILEDNEAIVRREMEKRYTTLKTPVPKRLTPQNHK